LLASGAVFCWNIFGRKDTEQIITMRTGQAATCGQIAAAIIGQQFGKIIAIV
jgi:hypothetical protein